MCVHMRVRFSTFYPSVLPFLLFSSIPISLSFELLPLACGRWLSQDSPFLSFLTPASLGPHIPLKFRLILKPQRQIRFFFQLLALWLEAALS